MSYNTFCDPNTGSSLRSDSGHDVGTIFGNCAAILGGIPSAAPTNLNCTDLSVIVMGDSNCICLSAAGNGCYNFIGNGNAHLVTGSNNFLGGGNNNQINSFVGSSVFGSVIVGGENNLICDNGSIIASDSFIGGGSDHHVYGAKSVVAGGLHNYVYSSCSFTCGGLSFVGAGLSNLVSTSWSSIISGSCNTISGGGYNNIIGSGYKNAITAITGGGGNNFIGAGCQNSIFQGSAGNAIGSGYLNQIGAVTHFGAIYSFIGSGQSNCIDTGTNPNVTTWDAIGAGQNNKICTNVCSSGVFVGDTNIIVANCSFIGGGQSNFIDSSHASPTTYAVIGGGQGNKVCIGTTHSSIFGGNNNCVSGSCSAILGGSGNNDGGLNWVGIFGCNITGVLNNAFHANQFVAQNMVIAGTPVPTGTLYYCNLGPGNCPVYIC